MLIYWLVHRSLAIMLENYEYRNTALTEEPAGIDSAHVHHRGMDTNQNCKKCVGQAGVYGANVEIVAICGICSVCVNMHSKSERQTIEPHIIRRRINSITSIETSCGVEIIIHTPLGVSDV
jgi:hypothetical protein